jgi:hypothetical protein
VGLISLTTNSSALGQDAKPAIKVVGIRVATEIPGDEMQRMSVFNGQTGTALAVLVQHPGGGLIAFDDDNSSVDAFADDASTNLLEGEGSGFGVFSPFTSISEDTKMALIEMRVPGVPAAGAKGLRAKGVFKFTHATKTKTAKVAGVALKNETAFEAGPFKFKIADAMSSGLSLESKQNTDAVRTVRFLDAEGKQVESDAAGSGYMGFGGDITYSLSYSLSGVPETATIEIEYWEDLKTLEIPFDVTAGVGLSK